MKLTPDIKTMQRAVQRGLLGPHMLAFLPAICLAAYWAGGEMLLLACALFTPLFYAITGGFARTTSPTKTDPPAKPGLADVAQDFLETALQTGQTTACFQIRVTGLQDLAQSLGDSAAADAKKQLVARVTSILRENDHVFPNGETRLTVLIAPGYRLQLDQLLDITKRIRKAAEEPLSISGTTQHVFVAIGVASSLTFGRNATGENWVDSATQAMNDASSHGVSATRVWSEKLSRQHDTRHALRKDLVTAFDQGQIQAYFQPQLSVRTGLVSGMEALVRWEHPDDGVLEPASFLQALQDSGYMDRLGLIMLRQSLTALRQWDDDGWAVPTIGVNFSATELRNPSLIDQIAWELDKFGLAPARLAVEVLETVFSSETDDIIRRNLQALADLGCRIDLDDYGTGHASITTLRHFPIQRIKIDRLFLRNADTIPEQKQMLCAILKMAEQLGLETLAEGVETLGEHSVLQDLECQYAQGFLFCDPKCARDISDWLAHHHATHATQPAPTLRRIN
ncbi:EAL domain-containing protein [Marivita sp. S0852]|uniref:EAL domain-containing protein n=1 Tax=Marivita sp. S0852 TaxID=3373893 RepID=UPI0039825290